MQPTVTVAICTWNRSHLLRQTLDRLLEVTRAVAVPWELLLVDNNSTDDTQAVARAYVGRLPLRVEVEPRQGLSHARNRVLERAGSDQILMTDDDVLVAEDWLAEGVAAFGRHRDAAVIGGVIEPWFAEPPDPLLAEVFPSLAGGFCALDHGLPEGPLAEGRYVWGANFGVRRSRLGPLRFAEWLGLNGAARIGGEETDLPDRLRQRGEQVVWIPRLLVRHYVDPDGMRRHACWSVSGVQGWNSRCGTSSRDLPR